MISYFKKRLTMADSGNRLVAALSEEDLTVLGFESRGIKEWKKLREKVQKKEFREMYGTSAKVLGKIWSDLQTLLEPADRIDPNKTKPVYFLLAYRFLSSDETQPELHRGFDVSIKSIERWCMFFVHKIALLRKPKIDSLDRHQRPAYGADCGWNPLQS